MKKFLFTAIAVFVFGNVAVAQPTTGVTAVRNLDVAGNLSVVLTLDPAPSRSDRCDVEFFAVVHDEALNTLAGPTRVGRARRVRRGNVALANRGYRFARDTAPRRRRLFGASNEAGTDGGLVFDNDIIVSVAALTSCGRGDDATSVTSTTVSRFIICGRQSGPNSVDGAARRNNKLQSPDQWLRRASKVLRASTPRSIQ